MVKCYVPRHGDLIWLNFSPHAGHEQAGYRPGLVLSPERYNRLSGTALVCPITSRDKSRPFTIQLPEGLAISGFVIADQLRNVDWEARAARFADKAPAAVIEEARGWIKALLDGC